ncbi:MAG: carboxypeptidase-like regulatory domain-containing protein, partial [Actinomycetota bacterium]
SLSLLGGLIACGALMAYGVTEEVPIGSVGGSVTMKENGKALPGALVTLEPIYKGDDESPIRIRHTETNADGTFSIKGVVAGDYLLTISGQAHEMEQHPIRVAEGARTEKAFPLPPMKPYLETYASQHVYTPTEAPKFQVKGFYEKGDLTFTAFRLDIGKCPWYGNGRKNNFRCPGLS